MAEAGYKYLISYKIARVAFELGWDYDVANSSLPSRPSVSAVQDGLGGLEGKEGLEAIVNYLNRSS